MEMCHKESTVQNVDVTDCLKSCSWNFLKESKLFVFTPFGWSSRLLPAAASCLLAAASCFRLLQRSQQLSSRGLLKI